MKNFIGTIPAFIGHDALYLAVLDGVLMVKTRINYNGTNDGSDTVVLKTVEQWCHFFSEGNNVVLREATGDDVVMFSTEALDEMDANTFVDWEAI